MNVDPQKIKDNRLIVGALRADEKAKENQVLVCVDEIKKIYAFVPLENVIYQGKPLSETFTNLENQIIGLKREMAVNYENIKVAIRVLTDEIEKGKFL